MSISDPEAKTFQKVMKVEGVSKAFGGIQALAGVSFQIELGHIHAVIGPNGAGKTTLFNIITGAYAPDAGRVVYKEKEIQGRKVHEIVSMGISRTFQNVELFGSLTALENVLVGRHVQTRCGFLAAIARWPWVREEEEAARQKALEILDFVGLKKTEHTKSVDLPFGWQRFLEIARALAAEPQLMLLDEPASGLNAVETQQLGDLLLHIKERGVTILLVEHDMSLTMNISDQILVLHQGMRLAEGSPREIQDNEKVISAYLGKV